MYLRWWYIRSSPDHITEISYLYLSHLKMNSHFRFSWLVYIILLTACGKPKETVNKFSDLAYVSILRLQDHRVSDSLAAYLKDRNADYRKAALLALASVQDSSVVNEMGKLLQDPEISVRRMAAFALGQTRCKAAADFLHVATKKEQNATVLAEIYEAYGKTSTTWTLHGLPTDSTSAKGKAWGIYRAGLAGVDDTSMYRLADYFLGMTNNESTRLAAAHYFSRGAKVYDAYENTLITHAKNDPSEFVRMACALSLRKINTDSSLAALAYLSKSDSSYRVRVNAVRALMSHDIQRAKDMFIEALRDTNVNVAIAASEALMSANGVQFHSEIVNLARSSENWRVQSNLYEAALAANGSAELAEEIKGLYDSASNNFQKAALLQALAQSVNSYPFVEHELFTTTSPVVRAAAASTLVAVNDHTSFQRSSRKALADIYVKAISLADPVVVTILCEALSDPALDYRKEIKSISFLKEVKWKLASSSHSDARRAVESAIAFFENTEVPAGGGYANKRAINIKALQSLKRDQKARVETEKGTIVLRLLVEEAPGSVVNFIDLVRAGYFDNKYFHRVVPNFVAQGGSDQGDGYGSDEYSIRSEFSTRRYAEGSVGMASSGKDTESTQWFITHSPTPHLDGAYTIFAVVESGMEVVHLLEVGDKILKIGLDK